MLIRMLFCIAFVLTAGINAWTCELETQAPKSPVVFTKADLEFWIEKWGIRDGLAGKAISDFFCQFVLSNPEGFLEVMISRRDVFDVWIRDVGDLSFTDFGGCLDRECLRTSMIHSVRLARVPPGVGNELREALLEKLLEIEVRVID